MFTAIPLEESIKIAANIVYSQDPNTRPLLEKAFFYLLKLSTGGILHLEASFYKQKDGVAVGSPLALIVFNLFMGHLEHKLNTYMKNVEFYARYFDYIVATVEDGIPHTFHLRIR